MRAMRQLFLSILLVLISCSVGHPAPKEKDTFGDVSVSGYFRRDGTYVSPHMRSRPDGIFGNNWSTRGNVNPYTGKPGTKDYPSLGGGSYYVPRYDYDRDPRNRKVLHRGDPNPHWVYFCSCVNCATLRGETDDTYHRLKAEQDEISRQIEESLKKLQPTPCPHCTGKVWSHEAPEAITRICDTCGTKISQASNPRIPMRTCVHCPGKEPLWRIYTDGSRLCGHCKRPRNN